jgi:hypothetical protein
LSGPKHIAFAAHHPEDIAFHGIVVADRHFRGKILKIPDMGKIIPFAHLRVPGGGKQFSKPAFLRIGGIPHIRLYPLEAQFEILLHHFVDQPFHVQARALEQFQ